MRVELFEGKKAIGELRPYWNAVYRADPEANYFLSFEWLFGTARGAGRYGFVLAVRAPDSDSGYVAFLPLRRRTDHAASGFHNELNLCGNYTSDYNGFICRPEYEQDAIPSLGAELRRMNWRYLRLLNFAASEKRTELFLRDFPKKNFETRRLNLVNPDGTDNGTCPYVMLDDDWEEFLKERVSANTRQKIRRFLRQVEGSEEYRITHANHATIDRDIEILLKLWTDRWGKQKGKRLKSIQESNRRLLKHAFEMNTLFMPVLWHEDRPVCVLAILVDRRKKVCNFYIGGRDESLKGPPAGLVMHAYAIRHAISKGFAKYDFLRGNEPYKYSFGSEEAHIRSVLVSTQSKENLGGRLDPGCLRFVLRRSAEFYRDAKLPAARRGYEQVLDVVPRHLSALYLHGMISARLGDHGVAIRQFRTLAGLKPDSIKTRHRLGISQIARKEWTEAADSYCELLERNRELPKAWYLLGRILIMLGQFDEAGIAFQAALRLRPDYVDAETGFAKALLSRGRLTARQAAQRAARHPGLASRVTALAEGLAPAGAETVPAPPIVAGASNGGQHPSAWPVRDWQRTDSALLTVLAASNAAPNRKPVMRHLSER